MTTSTTTTYTPKTWADHLLGLLGDPVTPGAETAVVAWEAQEGGNWKNAATYNPINTTQHEPGSGPMGGNAGQNNGNPVQAYTSWDQGFAATITTLFSGGSRYAGLRSALASGDGPTIAQAIVSSPWGTKSINLGNGATYTGAGGQTANGAANAAYGVAPVSGLHIPGTPWDIPLPSIPNPLTAAGSTVQDALGTLGADLGRFTILGIMLAGAAALVVLGVVRASGAPQAVKNAVQEVAPLASVVAK